jgi:hypothetical protein
MPDWLKLLILGLLALGGVIVLSSHEGASGAASATGPASPGRIVLGSHERVSATAARGHGRGQAQRTTIYPDPGTAGPP